MSDLADKDIDSVTPSSGREEPVERKTLQLRDPSETDDTAPALKKKGRGWEISE